MRRPSRCEVTLPCASVNGLPSRIRMRARNWYSRLFESTAKLRPLRSSSAIWRRTTSGERSNPMRTPTPSESSRLHNNYPKSRTIEPTMPLRVIRKTENVMPGKRSPGSPILCNLFLLLYVLVAFRVKPHLRFLFLRQLNSPPIPIRSLDYDLERIQDT